MASKTINYFFRNVLETGLAVFFSKQDVEDFRKSEGRLVALPSVWRRNASTPRITNTPESPERPPSHKPKVLFIKSEPCDDHCEQL